MSIKKHIFSLLICICLTSFGQQQPLFTNILVNQYLYNPAYAGVYKGLEVAGGYRNQWSGFVGAPKTLFLNGYSILKKKPKMALGGLISSDKMGLLQRNSFYASYSYNLKLSKKVNASFGISAGAVRYNVRVYDAKPYPTDQDDPFLKSNILNANAFDANVGLYLYSKKFFFSLSGQQITNSKVQWNPKYGTLTPHLYAYTGYDFVLDKKKKEWVLQPSLLIRYNNPAPYQLEANLKITYKDMFWIAGSYRPKASTSFLFGISISKQYTIAYAFDYANTNLQKYSTGSHEIVLKYSRPAKKRKTASDKIQDADEEELNNIDNSIKTNIKNKKKDEKK
jgi:type IX secretion system PorP/SprF family membrane protein